MKGQSLLKFIEETVQDVTPCRKKKRGTPAVKDGWPKPLGLCIPKQETNQQVFCKTKQHHHHPQKKPAEGSQDMFVWRQNTHLPFLQAVLSIFLAKAYRQQPDWEMALDGLDTCRSSPTHRAVFLNSVMKSWAYASVSPPSPPHPSPGGLFPMTHIHHRPSDGPSAWSCWNWIFVFTRRRCNSASPPPRSLPAGSWPLLS